MQMKDEKYKLILQFLCLGPPGWDVGLWNVWLMWGWCTHVGKDVAD